MYDPKNGRFITEDTYGGKTTDPLSLNKYVYCANNPVMYTDPDGHSFFSKIARGVKSFVKKAAKVVKRVAKAVVRTVKKVAKAVCRAVVHAVKTVGRAVAHAAKTVVCKAASMVRSGARAVGRAATNIVNAAKKKVLTVEEKAKQEINNFKSQVKVVTSKAVSELTKFTEAKAEELKEKFTGFVEAAAKEFKAVKNQVGSAINGISNFIDKHSEAINNILTVVSIAATVVGIFVPAIGVAMIAVSRTADALSTLMAIKEGDKGSILMSAVSILPIGKGLKLAEEGGEDALKAAKVTSAAIEEGKAVSKKPSLLCRVKKIFGLKGCFVAGTLVASEKGYKKIETIKVGDKVWSKDVNTGKIELKKVVKLYKHKVNSIVHLKINGKEIRTTINHPFYVAGQGWVQAGKLKKGNIVYTLDGKKETVESAETEEADEDEETVFNFQVEEYHTYFVGEDKILVHNNCEDDAAAAAKAVEASKGGIGSKLQEVLNTADNYKLSDDTFNKHIVKIHGSNSTISGKSHFNADFDIKSGIESTLKGDNFIVKPNTDGRSGYIFEQTFKDSIGVNTKGKPISTLKVVIDEIGNVITAYPKK